MRGANVVEVRLTRAMDSIIYLAFLDYMPTTHVILVSMQSWSSRISHRLLSQYFPGKLQGFVLPIHDHYSQTPQS
jgi:hypothetical protein